MKRRYLFQIFMAIIASLGIGLIITGILKNRAANLTITKIQTINKRSVVIPSTTKASKANVTYNFDDVKELTTNLENKGMDESAEVKQVGQVELPEIHLKARVNEGLSDAALSTGAGTLKPGERIGKGNFAIAGHDAYGRRINNWLFANLHLAQSGITIKLSDNKNIAVYQVDVVKIISIHDVDVIRDSETTGKPIITMLTCYSPKGHTSKTHRLMVRGTLSQVKRK